MPHSSTTDADLLNLRELGAFASYTDAELQELESIADIRDALPGEFICREGDYADAFYVLCGGRARVLRDIDGARLELGTLKPGTVFGQMALIRRSERIASVVCIEPALVMTVRRAAYDAVRVTGSPLGVRLQMHNTIMAIRQLRKATHQLMLIYIRAEAGDREARISARQKRLKLVSLQSALADWGLPVDEIPEPNEHEGELPMSRREYVFRTTGRL